MSLIRTIRSKKLKILAESIDRKLAKIYGHKMGFMLVCAPFDGPDSNGIADYIGNSKRATAINWLRETADRLEGK